MKYEDYKGSEQEKEEDRVFMEFNRRHGVGQFDHLRAMEGVVVIACIALVVGTIVWITLF